jgi:hypothetical protein
LNDLAGLLVRGLSGPENGLGDIERLFWKGLGLGSPLPDFSFFLEDTPGKRLPSVFRRGWEAREELYVKAKGLNLGAFTIGFVPVSTPPSLD